MGALCLARDQNESSDKASYSIFKTRYESISEEEAYIIYREQCLGLSSLKIDDLEQYLSDY